MNPINPLEIEATGAVKLNQLEVKLAECQLLAAEIDAAEKDLAAKKAALEAKPD